MDARDAAVGVAVGQLVWTVAAGVGLSGLLAASAPAFRAVQLVGAAVFWLATQRM